MNVSFRPATPTERELLGRRPMPSHRWMRTGDDYLHVISVDGLMVVAFDGRGQVIYQDDEAGGVKIADLIRADRLVTRAVNGSDVGELRRRKRHAAFRHQHGRMPSFAEMLDEALDLTHHDRPAQAG